MYGYLKYKFFGFLEGYVDVCIISSLYTTSNKSFYGARDIGMF